MPSYPLDRFEDRPFSVADGRAVGASRRRLDSGRLDRPFAGVRSTRAPANVRALCAAYLPRMAPHEFFSHRTAALLHGLWLPLAVERRLLLDVAVVKPHRAPRDARVIGHHLIDRPGLVVDVDTWPTSNPTETVCQLARVLGDEDLVVAAEALLPPHDPRSALALARLTRAGSDPSRHGRARLLRVLPRLRIGSRSPQETRLRLLLLAEGLPEPLLNHRPDSPELEWIEGDLVYPEQRVWIEVEGDGHRTDKRTWRRDVVRYERLADLGWRVIRVTADDIALRPAETVARIARALARA